MSLAAAVAWLTAAWPRSTASPTEFFTESTASSAVSVIVALGCRKCRRSRSVGLERGIHEVLLLSGGPDEAVSTVPIPRPLLALPG
jgi:hypothetical protein